MPDHDFKSPRLFVDAAIAEGSAIAAEPVQANYLLNVLRLGEADEILIFNGRDGEWRAGLAKPAKKKLDLVPRRQTRPQTPPPRLTYLFAPLKHARLDYMVQKAVEMGAGVLQPVLTQHVQAPKVNIDRMRANAVEAAEQCGILTLPECREIVRLADVVEGWDDGRRLVFCDEREDAASPIEILRQEAPGADALLVGPEGGFSQDERAMLRALPFVTVMSLGPRILRADTAAVAALAVLQAAVGDWTPPGAPTVT
ncbi:16S rRNA (uracil(1498)-N(3))-methyltransferase [Aurantimonas sp. MSK8Z-1]|uniref:16S rRNA (uracil(1498)-N(3))-methyltransferase n=1 Tax=Mangrovibrevibacter kandeliae TaxID=2968473 RepID=UPI002117F47D|nr:16S rRNA (uracil(1498)-N(3))-methyltransferase [Aurantimonas sp. MSK8Z-1]MCW4113574.1 16S rRNA (uracil(1498)-N(3))-methyltransferase [Aurantimonas sp. MSK8Z-1]